MISFYPGPSRVYDEVPSYVKDAVRHGLLSLNHRSEEFMSLYQTTTTLLRRKLHIPKDYSIYFTSSATECWEIIAQSLITRGSEHIFNGAFGEKWFDYTGRLVAGAQNHSFDPEKPITSIPIEMEAGRVICITQNETSNGTQIQANHLAEIKKLNPDSLLAVDATSSMGGIALEFQSADIWLASVQKCFGLPAGLGILICSPAAVDKALRVGEKKHYNSLRFLHEMAERNQTSYTPNVLGIYLLMRVLKDSKSINKVERKLKERHLRWMDFFAESEKLTPFISQPTVQSNTVIAVQAEPEYLKTVKASVRKKGFLLGDGYGPWKANTFRIANFPALKSSEIIGLMRVLKKWL